MKSGLFVTSPRQLQRLADRLGRPVRSMGAYVETPRGRTYGRVADLPVPGTHAVVLADGRKIRANPHLPAPADLRAHGSEEKNGFALSLTRDGAVVGYIHLYTVNGQTAVPTAAAAEKGLGPLLYDLAAMLSGYTIYPSSERSPAAKAFWAKQKGPFAPMKASAFELKYGRHPDEIVDDAFEHEVASDYWGGKFRAQFRTNTGWVRPWAPRPEDMKSVLIPGLGDVFVFRMPPRTSEHFYHDFGFYLRLEDGSVGRNHLFQFDIKDGKVVMGMSEREWLRSVLSFNRDIWDGDNLVVSGLQRAMKPVRSNPNNMVYYDDNRGLILRAGKKDVLLVSSATLHRLHHDNVLTRALFPDPPPVRFVGKNLDAHSQGLMEVYVRVVLSDAGVYPPDLNRSVDGTRKFHRNPLMVASRTPVTMYHPRMGLLVDVPGYEPIVLASVATVRSLYIENKLLRRKKFPPPPPLRFSDGKPTEYTLGALRAYVHSILSEERVKHKKNPPKVAYVGAILDRPEQLLNWWEQNVGPLHGKKFAHHMTIQFKPESLDEYEVGSHVSLRVVGYAQNEQVQAVAVEAVGATSSNAVPHITVATDGSPPVLSNDLLAGGYTPVRGPYLSARVGFNAAGKDFFNV